MLIIKKLNNASITDFEKCPVYFYADISVVDYVNF